MYTVHRSTRVGLLELPEKLVYCTGLVLHLGTLVVTPPVLIGGERTRVVEKSKRNRLLLLS